MVWDVMPQVGELMAMVLIRRVLRWVEILTLVVRTERQKEKEGMIELMKMKEVSLRMMEGEGQRMGVSGMVTRSVLIRVLMVVRKVDSSMKWW